MPSEYSCARFAIPISSDPKDFRISAPVAWQAQLLIPCIFSHEQEINSAKPVHFPIWSKEKSCVSLREGSSQEPT